MGEFEPQQVAEVRARTLRRFHSDVMHKTNRGDHAIASMNFIEKFFAIDEDAAGQFVETSDMLPSSSIYHLSERVAAERLRLSLATVVLPLFEQESSHLNQIDEEYAELVKRLTSIALGGKGQEARWRHNSEKCLGLVPPEPEYPHSCDGSLHCPVKTVYSTHVVPLENPDFDSLEYSIDWAFVAEAKAIVRLEAALSCGVITQQYADAILEEYTAAVERYIAQKK